MTQFSLRTIVATIGVACCCLFPGAEISRAQTPPAWKYITWTEIEVNDLPAVNSMMEKWTSFVKEHMPSYPPYEYMTGGDGKAYFVDFLKEFNDVPKTEDAFRKALEKYISLGLPDVSAQWMGAMNRVDSSIWELRTDLSYMPAGTAAAFEEPFRKLIIFHLKHDKVEAWQEATKAMNEADRKAGITKPRYVFEAKIGKDLPAFSYVVPAKDVFDYYSGFSDRTAKRKAAGGGDASEALQRCTRKSEDLHLTMHPECSKLPRQ